MYNKIMRRMNERVERYYGNNGSHNYRSREGANIPKYTTRELLYERINYKSKH